jgi:hypothetical protein
VTVKVPKKIYNKLNAQKEETTVSIHIAEQNGTSSSLDRKFIKKNISFFFFNLALFGDGYGKYLAAYEYN